MHTRRTARTAVLGGTFDRLHVGHEAVLAAAFAAALRVRIGVTTSRYLVAHPKLAGKRIAPYARRVARLKRFLDRRFPDRSYRITPLNDPFGSSIRPGIDVLVLTADTRAGGRSVNRERRRRGLSPLKLIEVPLVIAQDGFSISSTRIRTGEIDRLGQRLRRLLVVIATRGPPSLGDRAASAVRERFAATPVRIDRLDERPSAGRGTNVRSGSTLRSRAVAALPGHDIAVAVSRSRDRRRPEIAVAVSPGGFGDSRKAARALGSALARRLGPRP